LRLEKLMERKSVQGGREDRFVASKDDDDVCDDISSNDEARQPQRNLHRRPPRKPAFPPERRDGTEVGRAEKRGEGDVLDIEGVETSERNW
jgi:hypothetical protein